TSIAHSSPHHRDLHSFPTRRSSDLVAVSQNVEPGALLVADHNRHCVLKFLAETNVEHAGIERATPHTNVEPARARKRSRDSAGRSEEHTSELQSRSDLVCRLLLEKK